MTRLLFCDMDGTILDAQDELHPKNFVEMKRWQEEGNLIALCTGRNIMECQSSLKRFDIPYDYLVLNNGGHILDKEKTLYEKKISHNVGCQILALTTNIEGMWSYFCDGKDNYAYLDGKTYQHNGLENEEVSKEFHQLYNETDDFQILCFNQDNQEMNNIYYCLDQIQKMFFNDVETHINQFYVDVVPVGCSKGTGVKTLLSLIDQKIDKTYAIGDSFNDTSMFENVDVSATFNYADEEVKKKADKIVSYVYEFLSEEE